jgi:hypothetical protein
MAATEQYSGPSAREMLDSHTFAQEVIARSKGPESQRIFDDKQLDLLRRWCTDPASAERIFAEENLSDTPGDRPGTKAIEKGSLVGLLMANSAARNDLITNEEFQMLQEWFKQN